PGRYFQLVRSRTPPGEPLELVATRRPYDDPGVARPYYRLRLLDSTPVAKTFMPLELTSARMARLRELFRQPLRQVTELPGYKPETAANPFVTFRDLPVDSRYRFLLDDARFFMMGFMKGPVCRGQVALNVITDHFWVFFVAPDKPAPAALAAMLARDAPNLRLPAENDGATGLLAWGEYARAETRHMKNKQEMLGRLASSQRPGLSLLWDGGGNPDAALTVFRHFDSASVLRGLAGERPQTAMLIGYPLFERMHYLLLAGFDVYGNVGHQLASRLYMDFLRMEGELDFVTLLPRDERQATMDHWYRGTDTQHEGYLADVRDLYPRESGIAYRDGDRLGELYRLLQRRYAALRDPALDWRGNSGLKPAEITTLRQLSALRGAPAAAMPELSLLLVQRTGGTTAVVSLVRNSAHSNVAEMFDEDRRRLPGEDTLLALDGIAGAYPNLFFAVDAGELPEFAAAVAGLRDGVDLEGLVDRFGVRRSDRRFWTLSDEVHAAWRRRDPREAAVLDYSRYEDL
ncbi:MAG: peptidylprolyl isomerase, partial [Betaproteobacteria bacterium]|nr:peptidylprolyl isomerase [Betaproteobacteria bacterium]